MNTKKSPIWKQHKNKCVITFFWTLTSPLQPERHWNAQRKPRQWNVRPSARPPGVRSWGPWESSEVGGSRSPRWCWASDLMEGNRHTLFNSLMCGIAAVRKEKRRERELRTRASGDDKLLQTQVHVQIFLKDRELEREERIRRRSQRTCLNKSKKIKRHEGTQTQTLVQTDSQRHPGFYFSQHSYLNYIQVILLNIWNPDKTKWNEPFPLFHMCDLSQLKQLLHRFHHLIN